MDYQGNRGSSRIHRPFSTKLPIGHVAVSGESGDVIFVGIEDLCANLQGIRKGLWCQAGVGSATIKATLMPKAVVENTLYADPGAAIWGPTFSASEGAFTEMDVAACYMVKFDADATVYIIAV